MIFQPTRIAGVFLIECERREDPRGFFARSFCASEFAAHGLDPHIEQCSISYNHKAGTVRGMHFQRAPHGENKLVRCTRGAIHDIALDLRADSPSYKSWIAAELSADNRRMLYIPKGVAHGFQTLTDGAEIFYQIATPYHAESASGARWNDPAFGITLPLPVSEIAEKDLAYPAWQGTA